ncbi:hypothetical protein AB3S75_019699 [Citrus x aurantiifolia]
MEQLMNRVFVDAKKRSDGSRINACPIRSRCGPSLLQMGLKAEFIFSSYPGSKRFRCLKSLKMVNESMMPRLFKIVPAKYRLPQSLIHLSFSNIEQMDDPMPALEKLSLLQVLKLKQNSFSGR